MKFLTLMEASVLSIAYTSQLILVSYFLWHPEDSGVLTCNDPYSNAYLASGEVAISYSSDVCTEYVDVNRRFTIILSLYFILYLWQWCSLALLFLGICIKRSFA